MVYSFDAVVTIVIPLPCPDPIGMHASNKNPDVDDGISFSRVGVVGWLVGCSMMSTWLRCRTDPLPSSSATQLASSPNLNPMACVGEVLSQPASRVS